MSSSLSPSPLSFSRAMAAAERCSAGTTSSSSWVSAAEERLSAGDRMVKMEMEAAEALAGLAHCGMRESGEACFPGPESGKRKWGRKGKRAGNRVKAKSTAADLGNGPSCSAPRSSDLLQASLQDQAFGNQRKSTSRNGTAQVEGTEKNVELPKPHLTCTASYASCGGVRSRQKLSEAEKEARRLRRVLANRESARQTIRRRQALCEELTKKATDLASENENLKREKEEAVREYECLKNTNECLKAQVADAVKVKLEEASKEFKSPLTFPSTSAIKAEMVEAPGENKFVGTGTCSYSPIGCPMLYQSTYSPFLWSPVIQPPNGVLSQVGHGSTTVGSSGHPFSSIFQPVLSQDQLSRMDTNGPRVPLYVLPPRWFFQLPEIKGELQTESLFSSSDRRDETSMNHQSAGSSSSRNKVHVEDPQLSLPINIKSETSSSLEASVKNNFQDTHLTLEPKEGGHHTASERKEGMLLMSASLCSEGQPVTAKCEDVLQTDCVLNTEAILSMEVDSNKKLIDSVAAAEARKRRRELTKLKNLGRQCQMHC